VALGYGSSTKFGVSRLIFLQRQNIATSYLVHRLGLPKPIIKSHPDVEGLCIPPTSIQNISATAGDSAFELGEQLWFAKVHHKIRRRRKGGRGPRLGKLPKIWGSHNG